MNNDILNISVDEYTSPITSFATEEMKINEIIGLMKTKGFRHIPVLKNNQAIGIISDRDIALNKCHTNLNELKAKDIMTKNPYTVPSGTPLEKAALEMSERKIGSAIVVRQNGEIDGIFTSIDGLNALIEIVRGEIEQ